MILFAFSTMISWSNYGLKAWTYLFGEGKTSELVSYSARLSSGEIKNFTH
ncbi:MAG: Na+/alanine symporter [Paracoccaceae bacterium]